MDPEAGLSGVFAGEQVLYLFTDNFDYQHMRKDFVTGTLIERELARSSLLPPPSLHQTISSLALRPLCRCFRCLTHTHA